MEVGSTLTIGGSPVTVNPDGTFNVQVDLEEGENVFSFQAVDRVGLVSDLSVTITREKASEDSPGMGAMAAMLGMVVATVMTSIAVARRRR